MLDFFLLNNNNRLLNLGESLQANFSSGKFLSEFIEILFLSNYILFQCHIFLPRVIILLILFI